MSEKELTNIYKLASVFKKFKTPTTAEMLDGITDAWVAINSEKNLLDVPSQ